MPLTNEKQCDVRNIVENMVPSDRVPGFGLSLAPELRISSLISLHLCSFMDKTEELNSQTCPFWLSHGTTLLFDGHQNIGGSGKRVLYCYGKVCKLPTGPPVKR